MFRFVAVGGGSGGFPVFGYGVFRFCGRMPLLMFDRLYCGDAVLLCFGMVCNCIARMWLGGCGDAALFFLVLLFAEGLRK